MNNARGQPKVEYVLSTSNRAAMMNTNGMDRDGNTIQQDNHKRGSVDLIDKQLDSLDVLRKLDSYPHGVKGLCVCSSSLG